MGGKERDVFPGSITDGTDQGAMLPDMICYARKVKGMRAFSCVNGRALTCLHAIQAYPAATPELEAVLKKRELERGSR